LHIPDYFCRVCTDLLLEGTVRHSCASLASASPRTDFYALVRIVFHPSAPLFMRDMAGGSFRRSLGITFIPEFLSMNALMAGMMPVMTLLMIRIPGSELPRRAEFWFAMSIALFAGGIVAYPMNWWLVMHHLKHGMMTVRRRELVRAASIAHREHDQMELQDAAVASQHEKPSLAAVASMAALSVALFAVGIAAATLLTTTH
jgi:hypothetical protein